MKRIASILEELEISGSKLDSLQRRLEDPGHTAHGNDPLVGIRDIRSRKIKILDVGIVKDAAAPNRGDQHLEVESSCCGLDSSELTQEPLVYPLEA